jgi:hypothetical protein
MLKNQQRGSWESHWPCGTSPPNFMNSFLLSLGPWKELAAPMNQTDVLAAAIYGMNAVKWGIRI